MSLNDLPILFLLSPSLLQGCLRKIEIKRKTECCCPIFVYLNKDKLRMEPGEKMPTNPLCELLPDSQHFIQQQAPARSQGRYHSRVWTTSNTSLHRWFFFFLLFDLFQTFYWQKCHQVAVRLRLAFLLLEVVTAVVKMLQNAQNLNAEARYLPRLGALAVLLLFLILKKPRPKEDLALRVPKLSSSPVPPWEGDLGGRVAKLLPSTGGLTCLN